MSRLTLKSMIEVDLGYCCLYAFFRLYRKTPVIADRLGVTTRAVRKYKAAFRAREFECTKKDCCMLPILRKNLK